MLSKKNLSKCILLLFLYIFCFLGGRFAACLFPLSSSESDSATPTTSYASTSILSETENWGLSFQEEGQTPVANATMEDLEKHQHIMQKTRTIR